MSVIGTTLNGYRVETSRQALHGILNLFKHPHAT